ncbi:hypothetical protein FNV43_RR18356 [Rhamnella rubrinervis]|uniref:Uncharacterized protein n=1 Tax=Rhamnella rubrinervis TaxID=2594499 RepID=A0A8K0E3J5_9ROSA|nr:hypothetical protein FNV43_RR18356 [Rhamnella rubrinervis]
MEFHKSPVTFNEGVYYKVDDYETRRESTLSVHGGDGLLGSSPASSFLMNPLMGKKDFRVRPKNIDDDHQEANDDNNKVVALNPDAQEWHPKNNSAPEEERCLFLTFSNGYPLSHAQIIKFFTGMYGLVMGSEEQVKFMVDQRPLWCKRFQPRIKNDVCDNANG